MDLQTNLFFLDGNCKSTSGYSYLHTSFNSLAEHKAFSLKSRGELLSVISAINTKLNSQADRENGLRLLKVFLSQCSDDVFVDNCVSWMQHCIRICSVSSEKEIVILAYEILGSLFHYSGMLQELTKPVTSSVITKFLEQLQRISSDSRNLKENHTSLLRCTESVIRNFGGACTSHKGNLEQFLMKFLDHPDEQMVYLAARCVAVLPLVGGGGVSNINHKIAWKALQEKLLSHAHKTLDLIFEGIPEIPLFRNTDKITVETLDIPLPEENNPVIRIQRLSTVFINLTCFIKELLLHELPVAKRVTPSEFINFLIRGFAVNSNTVSKRITADKLIVGSLIPQMHIALFKLLDALILCCGQNLLEYGSIICRLVLQTLKWTAYDDNWPHGSERPYVNLRKQACGSLTLWLQTAKSGSCLEISSPDELIDLLLNEVKIRQTTVTLSGARTKGRHLTKQQRKQLKQGKGIIASPSESSWTRSKLCDETANCLICSAALSALQWTVQSVGSFLKPSLHKHIQDTVVKILLKVGSGDISAPYGDWHCRLQLYQLLHTLVVYPHTSWPPPLQFALQLFRKGQLDKINKVASFCHQSLNNLIKLVHPVSAPLLFPPSLAEMHEVIRSENHKFDSKIFVSENMEIEEHELSAEVNDRIEQTDINQSEDCNYSVKYHYENIDLDTQNTTVEGRLGVEPECDKPARSSGNIDEVNSEQESIRNTIINEECNSELKCIVTNNISSLQASYNTVDEACNKRNESNKEEQNDTDAIDERNDNTTVELLQDSVVSKENITMESIPKSEQKDDTSENESSDDLFEDHELDLLDSEDEEDGSSDDKIKHIEISNLVRKKGISQSENSNTVTNKVPSLADNYSISYMYDQSSDSCDSTSEPQNDKFLDSIEFTACHNSQDQREGSENTSASNIPIAESEDNPDRKHGIENNSVIDESEECQLPVKAVEKENHEKENDVTDIESDKKSLQSSHGHVAIENVEHTSQEAVKDMFLHNMSDNNIDITEANDENGVADAGSNKKLVQKSHENIARDNIEGAPQEPFKETSICDISDDDICVADSDDENGVAGMDSSKELLQSSHKNIVRDNMEFTSQEAVKETSACNISDDNIGVGDANGESGMADSDSNKELSKETSVCNISDNDVGVTDANLEHTSSQGAFNEPPICDISDEDDDIVIDTTLASVKCLEVNSEHPINGNCKTIGSEQTDENINFKQGNNVQEVNVSEELQSTNATLMAVEQLKCDECSESNNGNNDSNYVTEPTQSSDCAKETALCSSMTENSLEESSTKECSDNDVLSGKNSQTDSFIKSSDPGVPETKMKDENQDSVESRATSEVLRLSPNTEKCPTAEDSHSEKTEMEIEYIDISSDAEKLDAENINEPLKKKRKLEEFSSEIQSENNTQ